MLNSIRDNFRRLGQVFLLRSPREFLVKSSAIVTILALSFFSPILFGFGDSHPFGPPLFIVVWFFLAALGWYVLPWCWRWSTPSLAFDFLEAFFCYSCGFCVMFFLFSFLPERPVG